MFFLEVFDRWDRQIYRIPNFKVCREKDADKGLTLALGVRSLRGSWDLPEDELLFPTVQDATDAANEFLRSHSRDRYSSFCIMDNEKKTKNILLSAADGTLT